MISENSDHHPPEYVTLRHWNGNTHGWFGLRLSEVVWHVDAVGTGGGEIGGGIGGSGGWFGHIELQNPYSPITWIPVEGSFLVEHHLLLPVWKIAIAQPDFKKMF